MIRHLIALAVAAALFVLMVIAGVPVGYAALAVVTGIIVGQIVARWPLGRTR